MILALFTIDTPKPPTGFKEFQDLLTQRYGNTIRYPPTPFENQNWYLAVKPYHAGIFPFLVLDMMIELRSPVCHWWFAHDVLPYSAPEAERIPLDESLTETLRELTEHLTLTRPRMTFKGFGNRIDIGLNALALLYMDILYSLTKVEGRVLATLRDMQFETFGDPLEVKTFGLQKRVAARLGKSPVAIHKSLRSAKYPLLAETATAMKDMMV